MGARWLDLVDPTRDELLAALPPLDPDSLAQLAAPAEHARDARPTLEVAGGCIVGVMLIPQHVDDENRFDYVELDFVASPDQIVTIRKGGPGARFARPDVLDATDSQHASVGWLVHQLVDQVAESYLDLVDALYLEIDELEDHIDELSDLATRRRLSDLRHEMLHARKNVSATRAAVRRIVDGRLDIGNDERVFPREVEVAFADTYDTLVRTTEELDVARDLLASVRDYLQATVAERQNEVVKKLTVVASLVLVPTLITGFYGQNFEGVFDRPLWSLTTSVALIVGTTVLQLAFFRWKRWI